MKNWKALANTKPPRTTEPELYVLADSDAGKGKIRINEAASALIGVAPGEKLALLEDDETNSFAVVKVTEDFGLAAAVMNRTGKKVEGAIDTGAGVTLLGTNRNFHVKLGGLDTHHRVFSVSAGEEVEGLGLVCEIEYKKDMEKIVRTASTTSGAQGQEDADDDDDDF